MTKPIRRIISLDDLLIRIPKFINIIRRVGKIENEKSTNRRVVMRDNRGYNK